jgi:hypothetical protein
MTDLMSYFFYGYTQKDVNSLLEKVRAAKSLDSLQLTKRERLAFVLNSFTHEVDPELAAALNEKGKNP